MQGRASPLHSRTRQRTSATIFVVACSAALGLATVGSALDRAPVEAPAVRSGAPTTAPRAHPGAPERQPLAHVGAAAIPQVSAAPSALHLGNARLALSSPEAAESTARTNALGSAALPTSAEAVAALVPAPPGLDPALAAARTIARRVRSFHSFRSEVPRASWRDGGSAWRVRSSTRCLAAAAALHVPTEPVTRTLTTPVPTPLTLTGPVSGVTFRAIQSDRQVELSCELITRLPALSRLLRSHGVTRVHVNSSYRDQPRVSFHTFGLALDIAAFDTKQGALVVATDFEATPDVETCAAAPTTERGRALLALACALGHSGLFSSVLTPNYNAGHRDHFHLDVRPDDARLFLR
jgi:hypothetical protein